MDENFTQINDKMSNLAISFKSMMGDYSNKLDMIAKIIQLRVKSEDITQNEIDEIQN